ncbi:MAG: hypothetical protein QM753_11920 [Thermomicrobiales bacterium]
MDTQNVACHPVASVQQDIRIPATGERIGFLIVRDQKVEAWGYRKDGTAFLLHQYCSASTEFLNRAACRVWRYYEASRIKLAAATQPHSQAA